MRLLGLLVVTLVIGLSGCSLQLPADNNVKEPFFNSTYGW